MNYFHDALLTYGFTESRKDFYTRPASALLGGPLYCSTATEEGAPRKLLLWQAQRVLLQGEAVTLDALEQVLRRVLEQDKALLPPPLFGAKNTGAPLA